MHTQVFEGFSPDFETWLWEFPIQPLERLMYWSNLELQQIFSIFWGQIGVLVIFRRLIPVFFVML